MPSSSSPRKFIEIIAEALPARRGGGHCRQRRPSISKAPDIYQRLSRMPRGTAKTARSGWESCPGRTGSCPCPCKRPVVVLARAVYAGKGLFVQQADKAVAVCDLLHDLHADLVLIVCGVCIGIDRSHFVLSRGDLVMPRFRQNAELPQFLIKVLCIRQRADGSFEIVILKLLTLGFSRTGSFRKGADPRAPKTALYLSGNTPAPGRPAQLPSEYRYLRKDAIYAAPGGLPRRRSAAAAFSYPAPRRNTSRTRWGCTAFRL